MQITLYDYQMDAIKAIKQAKNNKINKQLVVMATGLGKEQPLYSKIRTPYGWKTMGEVNVGDEIIGSDGNIYHIDGVFPQGIKPTYRVYFSDDTFADCGLEHLWKTRTFNDRSKNRCGTVKTTKEIINTIICGSNKRLNHSIPYIKPVKMNKINLPLDPYLVGFLIGDGGLTQDRVVISNSEDDLLKKIIKLIPSGMTLKHISNYDYLIKCNSHENKLIKELKKLNLMGKHSYNKFIPEEYLLSSIEDRINLLRGLIDTDGYVPNDTGSTIEYSTTSEILANQIIDLVRGLGGKISIKKRMGKYKKDGNTIETRINYRVYITFYNGVIPVSSKKHLDKIKNKPRNMEKYISKIEYIGDFEAQCIMVNSPDHLYVTDDYILTHNTIVMSSLVSILLADKKVLIMAHTTKLLQQTVEKYLFVNGQKSKSEIGILNGTHKNFDKNITVAGISTISRDETLFKFSRNHFDVIIIDEAHRSASPGYLKVLRYFGINILIKEKDEEKFDFDSIEKITKNPTLIGFTATPFRNDDKDLGSIYEEIVFSRDIFWALTQDPPKLCPPVAIQIDTDIDLTKIKSSNGDFNMDELSATVNIDYVNTLAVEVYEKYCPGDKCIVFCVDKKHSKDVCEEFKKANINSAYIDSDVPEKERVEIFKNFKNGKLKVLVNCMVLTEGFDEASLQALINLRPTQSRGLFEQMLGRVLRKYPGKDFAKIIDIAHNSGKRKIISMGDILQRKIERLEAIAVKKGVKERTEKEIEEDWQKASNVIYTEYKINVSQKNIFGNKRDFVWLGFDNYRYIEIINKNNEKIKVEIKESENNPEMFNVYSNKKQCLDYPCSFEWAYGYADSYVQKETSKNFKKLIKSDAEWRLNPPSEKQLEKIIKWFNNDKLIKKTAIRIIMDENYQSFSGLNKVEKIEKIKKEFMSDYFEIRNLLILTENKLKLFSRGELSIIIGLSIDSFKNNSFYDIFIKDELIIGKSYDIYKNLILPILKQRVDI